MGRGTKRGVYGDFKALNSLEHGHPSGDMADDTIKGLCSGPRSRESRLLHTCCVQEVDTTIPSICQLRMGFFFCVLASPGHRSKAALCIWQHQRLAEEDKETRARVHTCTTPIYRTASKLSNRLAVIEKIEEIQRSMATRSYTRQEDVSLCGRRKRVKRRTAPTANQQVGRSQLDFIGCLQINRRPICGSTGLCDRSARSRT